MAGGGETEKRRLLAEAAALDPFDRDLANKAKSLRHRWSKAGRSATKVIDDALWKQFDGELNDTFASRIPKPKSVADVRALARTLASEWGGEWPEVASEQIEVVKTGIFRSGEEHRVTQSVLFRGRDVYSRKMHAASYLERPGSSRLSTSFEKTFLLYLRSDGELMKVEATENGRFATQTWWTSRVASRADDADLSDADYLFRKRRLHGPNTNEEFMYEFEKWKDGQPLRIGLRLRDLLFNVRRNQVRS